MEQTHDTLNYSVKSEYDLSDFTKILDEFKESGKITYSLGEFPEGVIRVEKGRLRLQIVLLTNDPQVPFDLGGMFVKHVLIKNTKPSKEG